nr:hypothetical protein [Candidatus Levybacteria bacterium]
MRQLTILTVAFFLLVFIVSGRSIQVQATSPSDGHTTREEAEGKAIWEKLQARQVDCKNLTNDNFEVLGEYFMGKMVGSSHEVMNNMMVRMMGEEGEKQMHTAMGKKNSGCDTSAQLSQNGIGFMPMMWMMGGGANSMTGFGNVMGLSGFSFFGFLMWIFWTVVLVDSILLGVWLWKKIKKER